MSNTQQEQTPTPNQPSAPPSNGDLTVAPSEKSPGNAAAALTSTFQVEQSLAHFFEAQFGGNESPLEKAIAENINSEHLTHMFKFAETKEANRHAECINRHNHRPYIYATCIGGGLVCFLALVWMCLSFGKSEILVPIITALAGAVGGGGVGYGWGRHKSAKSEKGE